MNKHTPTLPIKLKTQQSNILLALYKYRYLNRIQIQYLLKHKTWTKIIIWLNQLTDQGIITRFYDPHIGGAAAVYCLASKSRQYLETLEKVNLEHPLLKRLYKEQSLSQAFHTHCLFLADIFLSLDRMAITYNSTLHFLTKTTLYGKDYLLTPLPDAYIAIKEKSGNAKRYFLVLIDPGTPRKKVKLLAEKYIEYAEDNEWQDATGHPFPKIIFILPTEGMKRSLHKQIQGLFYGSEEPSFYLSTWGEVRASGLSSASLHYVEVD